MLKQYRVRDYKFRLILWLLAISSLGVLVIGSALEEAQDKQIYGLIFSLFLMVVISLIDYTWILNFYWIMYGVMIMTLVAVVFFGEETNGATRWIEMPGGFTFQPSELAKLVLILFFARFMANHEQNLNTFKTLLISVVCVVIPLFLIRKQPDLSTTIVIALVFCYMLYIAGLSYKIIGGIILVCIPVVAIGVSFIMSADQSLLEGYQMTRILAWLNPSQYPDEARQQQNSIIAIGSGQLSGKGLDTNSISSVKNGNFISEQQTDFIFAVVGEELGFIGCCAIIILLFLIALECIWIGRKARDMAGKLICNGIAGWIMFQCFVNIGVATGLLPNTGLPLPFVSYGLTSLVSLFIGMGIVLNIGLQSRKYYQGET